MRMASCIVDASLDGQPLWAVVEQKLALSSKAVRRAKRAEGTFTLDGAPVRTNTLVHTGQTVAVAIDDALLQMTPGLERDPEQRVSAQPGPLDIVFEDDDLVVLDKPAGAVVHPCSGQRDQTLGNFLLFHLQERGIDCALHPVYRIDKPTTGLVVFTTTGYAQSVLQRQLETHVFTRDYLALCTGSVPCDESGAGSVEAPIGRVGRGPRAWDVCAEGKHAHTRYQVLARFAAPTPDEGELSLVRFRLETGRTHQIRVHMAHLGHPLLGDTAYGTPSELIARAALHSWNARLVHPFTGAELAFEAPVPDDMARLVPPEVRSARVAPRTHASTGAPER